MILKGHILVEYSVNCYLESLSKIHDPDFFKERFTFAEKLNIAKHFGPLGNEQDNLYQEIFLLNRLRNSIAHTLTFDSNVVRELFAELAKKNPKFNDVSAYKSDRERFVGAISFICGAVFAFYKLNTDKEDLNDFISAAKAKRDP